MLSTHQVSFPDYRRPDIEGTNPDHMNDANRPGQYVPWRMQGKAQPDQKRCPRLVTHMFQPAFQNAKLVFNFAVGFQGLFQAIDGVDSGGMISIEGASDYL